MDISGANRQPENVMSGMFEGSTRTASYPDLNRQISTSTTSRPHPLNVKPGGNQLLGDPEPSSGKATKSQLLGYLDILPESLLLELLSYVESADTLRSLAHTSRIMYAYLYDEEIWRRLYFRQSSVSNGNLELKWRGSWRKTLLQINTEALVTVHRNQLCSDVIYRPFQCSQIDYERLFHKIIVEEEKYHKDALEGVLGILPEGRIQRFQENEMHIERFRNQWTNKPFILVNNDANRWPQWDLDTLAERFSDVKFRQELAQWDLSHYVQYARTNKDELPLYLFDCSSDAMKELRKEYKAPAIFQEDLFKVWEQEGKPCCRPDYAWIIMGPARTGSTFHKDPNYTSAWNTALVGRKIWIMFPPDILPPGVGIDGEESEVTAPVGIAEWVISGFFNDSLKVPGCQVAVTFPGECMYVPSGWWHSVINIDESVALTQNFVPQQLLANGLFFLKNKREQISGFYPAKVCEAIGDFLQNQRSDENEDEDMDKIRNYLIQFEKLDEALKQEDCGEITEDKLTAMPIFELYKKFLIASGHGLELTKALQKLQVLEENERAKRLQNMPPKHSDKWEKLTELTCFTFNFDNSDSDED
ncbi:uncharacterized protein KQ657_001667 [Scheffersomyces spartinae]|uniref:JmjC domain-containing protein n=1 Tax=Scheffersomyces spartinae TaxID=45513 RepID=A0A9P8AHJ1_9ASCO|nr:uncharacterized protein KQ657_001667 [Scheffersomyces spartinae]KAG7192567.1 hypothetical protein KQ657_001667 [Scheffersomyces spartinae]